MKITYLNDPSGLKPAQLNNISVDNAELLAEKCVNFICTYLVKTNKDRFYFAQNLTTHFVDILSLVKKKTPEIKKIYISSHELKWLAQMFQNKDFQPDATHSNYHENSKITYPKYDIEIFDFEKTNTIIESSNQSSIFYISHISRMTGETVDIENIFKTLKSKNPDSILIIDGAQALGAQPLLEINNVADVYLGISSKFIGAEPELGLQLNR